MGLKQIIRTILFVTCCNLPAAAQQFYFPAAQYTTEQTLDKNISRLAGELIEQYKKNGDASLYFNNLYHYQLAAGHYPQVGAAIDSLRNIPDGKDSVSMKGAGFAFRTFTAASATAASRDIDFADAYKRTFSSQYNQLPTQLTSKVPSWFNEDVTALRKQLDDCLQQQTGKDLISSADAARLCKAYASWKVFSKILPLAKRALAEQDDSQYIIEDSLLVPTHDGARVSVTVIRKKNMTAPLPAVLLFNIYTGYYDKLKAKEAAINGYVGVVANTRGKKQSESVIEPFEHDGADAHDVIDWISKQPWSNGKVGMVGGSYVGFSQWAAANHLHPALKTIVPQVAVGIGIDYPAHNNVFMSYMLRWIHYVTNSRQTDEADFANGAHWDSTFKKWYASGRPFRALDTIEGRPSNIFQRWLQHPSHDAYWQQMVPYKEGFANINIPVLTTTGYYDDDQRGALYYFQEHYRYNKNPQHYLVIGPYDHPGGQSIAAGKLAGYKVDSVARIDITTLVYQWFDHILKGGSKPALLKDKVNYEVMGANEWRHAPSLQAMNNDTITLYLTNTRSSQHYNLSTTKPAGSEFLRQEVDFKDRSDTLNADDPGIVSSSLDVKDGLSFISKPFEKTVAFNGSFTADLEAMINKKDMDLQIGVYELLPDGKYFRIAGYIGRASYSKDRSKRILLQPGKQEKIAISNSYFTSRQVSKGSSIIVVIGVVKTPNWQINYGTGKDVSAEDINDAGVPLEIKWSTNSCIKLGVKN
ncbi:MAG TPA: CocE/NonD family hydrolase [Chitinophaga sp.]|uniref:CocE/NonD family hydrolase n=1 Tax=Chitinophaga sp. TaxID=1869181 RepID=UPI002CEC5418|nr:CocE/NonD family hydrolase [Chitinophaga sp.]HVI47141.1 CocE/NonD family hydrolase [Chitinophaga sp.]